MKSVSLAMSVMLSAGLLFACSPLSSNTATTSSDDYYYQAPQTAKETWNTASLKQLGIDVGALQQMQTQIETQAYTGISSVLIAYQDQLVFEEYYDDWSMDKLHSTRSASKSITSALIGIAIDQGFIASENERVLPYFPEYEGKIQHWDEAKRDITLAHILSMTSGIIGNEDAMYPTDDWIKFYLDQPLQNKPGETFSYATSGVVTLGNIITRASGMRIPAFTDQYLFGPLGITEYRWPITNSLGSQGLAMTGGGLNLRPRDMLKFGQLYLNKGKWKGKQLISEQWIVKSTQKQSTSDLYGEDFGYLWRMIDRNLDGKPIRSIEAWGNGGQFIMIFPSLELVAVFTGENYGRFPQMEQPFELVEKYILPTFKQQ